MAGASRTALAAWKRRLRSMLREQHKRQQRRARSHRDANATSVHGALFETAPWVRRFETLVHNAWEAERAGCLALSCLMFWKPNAACWFN